MLKILISDYQYDAKSFEYKKQFLQHKLPDCEVVHYVYEDDIVEYEARLLDVDYVITSFVPHPRCLLTKCSRLKAISVSATGYGVVDIKAAEELGISVYNVNEYCTNEVATHTIALALALIRGIKAHDKHISETGNWDYRFYPDAAVPNGLNAVIYGFGKIGKRVSEMLYALGMNIYVVSKHADAKSIARLGYHKISENNVGYIADVICNHESAGSLRDGYFDEEWFRSLVRRPIFINVGRGCMVDEKALVTALDEGLVRAAGIDVLADENPNVYEIGIVGRENVLITPHSAFYSEKSVQELENQACMNIINNYKNNADNNNCVVKGMR